MVKQEHQTRVNDRVRIKDYVTHMYPDARVYNEAIVRARQHDQMGYPVIFIEWDKDHWAYSGEQDRWVLEAHFDLVEDQMAEDKKLDDLLNGLSDLVANFRDKDSDEVKSEDKAPSRDPRPTKELSYVEILAEAMEDAEQGDAFIVLVAKPENFNGAEIVVPHVYMHSKREDAALMLDAAMADAAAQTHGRLVAKLLEAIRGKDKEDGSSST